MKKLLLIVLLTTGCRLPYNRLKHSDTPYTTKAMYQLFKSVGSVVRQNALGRRPYTDFGIMPADEFIDTSALYKGRQLNFATRIELENGDLIRVMWDYDKARFNSPTPRELFFPYPHTAAFTNTRYYIKFIPVGEFQKLKPEHVWDNSALIAGIQFNDVAYLHRATTERAGGFIDRNYHELYLNCFSALGQIYLFQMKDGSTISCYAITSDMYDNTTPRYVRWKFIR